MELVAVALEGEGAPGTGGGTYSSFSGPPGLNDLGEVAFWGIVDGGTSDAGIFLVSAGTHTAVALEGQSAPDSGGGTYSGFFGSPVLDTSGEVAFWAGIDGGATEAGIFLFSGGTVTAVALEGQTAPDTGGESYSSLSSYRSPDLNESGDVVFSADVTGIGDGIFLWSGGTGAAVALEGELAPDTGGETYQSLSAPDVNGADGVVFYSLTISSGTFGLFLDSAGTHTAVVLEGQPAPGAGSGTFDTINDNADLNDSGQVAFLAHTTNGVQGLFLDSGGTRSAVAVEGDAAPDSGGGSYLSFGHVYPVNSSGEVAFLSTLTGGTVGKGIFLGSGGAHTAVALPGQTAPGTGGGTFSNLTSPDLNASGEVAFVASVTGGTASRGVFLLPEPHRISGLAAVVLVLSLLRGRRRSHSGNRSNSTFTAPLAPWSWQARKASR